MRSNDSRSRRFAWVALAVGVSCLLLSILYSAAGANPAAPLDNSYLLADPSEVIVTNWPTPMACPNGVVVGMGATCPMYVVLPTVEGQEGREGVPFVLAGSQPGTQGLFMLLALSVLFIGGLGLLLGFLYVFVVRPSGAS